MSQQNDTAARWPFRDQGSDVSVRRVLPSAHRRMIGPLVLIDQVGPADLSPGKGFERPPHPHVGVETITYLVDGEIVQRDNAGSVHTLRPGEVHHVTAGSGIVHSERTPPDILESGSNLFGIQAWVALPSRHEETTAGSVHYSAPEIPRICARGVEFTLIAGKADGLVSPVNTFSDLVFAAIVLTSGARYRVKSLHSERAVYVVAGTVELLGGSASFGAGELMVLEPGVEVVLRAPAFHSARLMLFGGEPPSEPRHMHWNFVSTSVERIEQAKNDWREGRFPKVPGENGSTPLPEE